MRIDKFLWSVRIYKTRSIAAEEIKKNRVFIGESAVKSSREVREGDVIRIRKNQIEIRIKVLQIPKSRLGARLVPEYVRDMTEQSQYDILKMRRLQQNYYRAKGEGRPTKKDRRDIHEFMDDDEGDTFTFKNESYWEDFFNTDDAHQEEDE